MNEEIFTIIDTDDDWSTDLMKPRLAKCCAAIEDLPANYKTAVKLFLVEGYDHQEISEILDISENASRTYLHRGKTKLKEKLKHLRYGTGY